jgi:DNA processing protein
MPRAPHDIPDATLRLLLAEGVGPITLGKLREHFGDDDRIAGAAVAELSQISGVGRDTAHSIRAAIDDAEPDREREAMAQRGATMILRGDEDYPALLSSIADAPAALWMRGSIITADRLAVAIVGSRKCTAYGREQAGRLATLLAQSGLVIVSGGALGVDGEAHRGAMRAGGRTIVVAGCGLATDYPSEHSSLFDRIVADGSGAIVSELPMKSPPASGNFPRRNRIISGMSLGVMVIEAALRSGALITARLAAEEHHREVMALPGRVDSPASAGCHKAIREGWAALVTNHAEVISQLDSSGQLVRGALEAAGHSGAVTAVTLFDGHLSEAQSAIVKALHDAGDALLVDQLAARTQLPMSQIMADLTLLQIRGRVAKDFGGNVRLKRS